MKGYITLGIFTSKTWGGLVRQIICWWVTNYSTWTRTMGIGDFWQTKDEQNKNCKNKANENQNVIYTEAAVVLIYEEHASYDVVCNSCSWNWNKYLKKKVNVLGSETYPFSLFFPYVLSLFLSLSPPLSLSLSPLYLSAVSEIGEVRIIVKTESSVATLVLPVLMCCVTRAI